MTCTASLEFLRVLKDEIGEVLGIGLLEPIAALQDPERMRSLRSKEDGKEPLNEELIQALIQERIAARNSKNFGRAEENRKELELQGIQLIDGPTGTTWQTLR